MAQRPKRLRQHRLDIRRRLHVERLTDRRVLAAITGAVFEDLNRSMAQDSGEVAAAARLIYLDTNADGQLNAGESLSLAGPDGTFRFDDLADGEYRVALYNAAATQSQTFPVDAQASPALAVGNQLTAAAALPDGRQLVVGSDITGDQSWIVDADSDTVTPLAFHNGAFGVTVSATGWGQLAIDGDGNGVILEHVANPSSAASIPVRAVDATNVLSRIEVTTTTTSVPADTQVLSSATGVRSVFAWSSTDGLELSLWSNATSTLITSSPINVPAAVELLAFDDAAGLVALRSSDGSVSIHDVDGNFASLYSITDDIGAITIDGERDRLMAYSAADAALKVFRLQDADLIAEIPLDLSTLGSVTSIDMEQQPDALIVLGDSAVQQIKLDQPTSHRVTIAAGADVGGLKFGVVVAGANAAPTYSQLPIFSAVEDQTLNRDAPRALVGSSDVDGDAYVLVQTGAAANGIAEFRTDGSLTYTPSADFNGADSVTVVLHDGQSVSEAYTLTINVAPVADPPIDINVDIGPIREDIAAGTPIGTVEVIDVDGGGHIIAIDDPRFGEQNGQIIFIGGDINFENERLIPLIITGTDPETGETISENASVQVTDANDPITGITPTEAFVFENAPGDIVTELKVLDEDEEQFHTFTVDDPRFIVDSYDLRLADGVAVDYETEREIIVRVTATEFGTGGTYTETITITVRDLPEQPSTLALTDHAVVELTLGDVAGDVLIDGSTPDPRFDLTVDDQRFEIEGTTLKLKEDVFVELAVQSEIQVVITATDSQGEFASIERTFIIAVLPNETPLHNRNDPFDVDHGGSVTAADALAIINYLNVYGPGPVGSGGMGFCYDVNADGFITALDVLLVLNRLDELPSGTVGGEGEGEQIPAPEQQTPIQQRLDQPTGGLQIAVDSSTPAADSSPNQPRDAMFVQWQRDLSRDDDAIASWANNDSVASTADVDESLRLLSDENA
ncbi:hypothetical protein Poly51_10780 [Rubripirellula tenax]|uniref:Dockerin type I repeat protein n=1 Tax=Rubripirellula tenax TaxID=2528015 RepID=A0A5C6FLB2_9BACT|nr:Ig-like domain-containing protein [Rubripirellula tenax]TWU60797.1 hypothetical protein Poly51_10780 [Rubripirellula tenax]